MADSNASVRAIRRKGSWESNESGWSWKAAQNQQVPHLDLYGAYGVPRMGYTGGLGGIAGDEAPTMMGNDGMMLGALGQGGSGERGNLATGDSFATAYSRLSRRSDKGEETAPEHGSETPGLVEQPKFELGRVPTPITA